MVATWTAPASPARRRRRRYAKTIRAILTGWLPTTTVKRAKIGGLGRRPGMGTGDG
jgi:hypothetical protein